MSLKYKGYETGKYYWLNDNQVKLKGFCSQKVWIKKYNQFRIREFAILETDYQIDNILFQLGKTKWQLKEGDFSS